ncbi:EAL domain-containing protein [Aromatoleum evansii]|uniref:EAL domain-containing protein n=1 Tax=Aromatoleum evansii TaxID=59406 RepID=UPI00145E3F84|nr:EAL domain-containing protein [Aromatoleum evansii]NMG32482.1 EAL domain-containing protein [Aromatoleum evansii]
MHSLSSADFQLLFEAMPHPYLILRPDVAFTIVAVNDRYLAATGTSRDAMVDHGLFEIFPDNPDDASGSGVSDLRASLNRVIADNRQDIMGVQKYDIPLRDGSGQFEVKYWSPVNTPVADPAGGIAFIIHHVEDVTEFILSREQANQEAAEKLGKVEARAERMEAEVLHRAAEVKEANRALKRAMEDLEQREAELARLNARLKELDRDKTEFFSNVSHEFRTPLTLILGPLEELLDREGSIDSAHRLELLRVAYRNVLRLMKLVNALLDFSHIEAGRSQVKGEATDLAALTADLASNFRSACERAGLTLTVDCPPLPKPISVDRGMWEKILLNLLSNAFKFTFEGGISVRLRTVNDNAELQVQDTGTGIPARELPRIFERFHRVEGARGRSFEGSGIGLALVRKLVELHGGTIRVESELGNGSCFIVQIPLQTTQPTRADAASSHAAHSARALVEEALHWLPNAGAADNGIEPADAEPPAVLSAVTPAEILIADDNADMRGYLHDLLSEAGHRVHTVTNGDEALAASLARRPDLILTDVMMPGMDGFGLLRALREHPQTSGLPIILLSARAGEEARIEGLAAGADDYLIKPFHARELVARIDGALRLAQARRDATEALRRSAAEIADLYDHAPCGYHTLDSDGVIVRINATELQWLGYGRQELVGALKFADLLASASHRSFQENWGHIKEGGNHSFECDMIRKNGVVLPVAVQCMSLTDEQGHFIENRAILFDITERRQAEHELRRAATVFNNTTEAIIIADAERNIVSVNRAFTEISGFTLDEVLGKNPRLHRSDRHDGPFYERLWHSLEHNGHWQGEIWNRRKNGETYPCWENISVVKDEQGRIANYVSVFSDISAIKAAEEQLRQLAHCDSLTGLSNRLMFANALPKTLKRAPRHQKKVALLFLDLDRFKLINDTLGHAAGDQLLQEVARRLQQCVRGEDLVARLGGDEFTIVLEEINEAEDVTLVAGKIIAALAEPIVIQQRKVVTSTSIGISIYPNDADSAEDLAKAADAAMYRAKARGRNTFEFYTAQLTVDAQRHLAVEHDLREALANRQFELYYQPQVELATGRIVGVEALLRWRHPKQGLMLPDEFIRVAEESGLIQPIGEWVIREACQQAATWQMAGITPLRMAINISGRQLLHDHLILSLTRAIHESGLDPSTVCVELEITEGILQAVESAPILQELQRLGVMIAIDDFGTGYSSLSRIKHLPVDTLKIAHGFVQDLPDDADNTAITTAIISLAHNLGLNVIAEGVENVAQLSFLRSQGCAIGQGHLFSQAVPAADFIQLSGQFKLGAHSESHVL